MDNPEIAEQATVPSADAASVAVKKATYICTHCDAVIAEPRPATKAKGTFVCEHGHEVKSIESFGKALVGGFIGGIGLFLIFFLLPFGVLYVLPWKIIQIAFFFVAVIGIGGIYYGPYLVLKSFFYVLRSATVRCLAGGTLGMGLGSFMGSAGSYGLFLYLYGLVDFFRVIYPK